MSSSSGAAATAAALASSSRQPSGRCWRISVEALSNSPSRADGISEEEEHALRRAGCAHIGDVAARLFVGDVGKAQKCATSGSVLFQRFCTRLSLSRFDRWLIAEACLFIGCKAEECHRKIRDVIFATYRARYQRHARPAMDVSSPGYLAHRNQLTDAERQVMYALEFDVAVEAPYGLITACVKRWKDAGWFGKREERSPDAATLDRMAGEIAFAMVTCEMGLLWTAQEIATASLCMALHHIRCTTSQVRIDDAQVASLMRASALRAMCTQYAALVERDRQKEALALSRGLSRRAARHGAEAALGGAGGEGGPAGQGEATSASRAAPSPPDEDTGVPQRSTPSSFSPRLPASATEPPLFGIAGAVAAAAAAPPPQPAVPIAGPEAAPAPTIIKMDIHDILSKLGFSAAR